MTLTEGGSAAAPVTATMYKKGGGGAVGSSIDIIGIGPGETAEWAIARVYDGPRQPSNAEILDAFRIGPAVLHQPVGGDWWLIEELDEL